MTKRNLFADENLIAALPRQHYARACVAVCRPSRIGVLRPATFTLTLQHALRGVSLCQPSWRKDMDLILIIGNAWLEGVDVTTCHALAAQFDNVSCMLAKVAFDG